MARPKTHKPATFSDLPPELWDHIASYLPSARSVASLGRTNRSLHAFVEKDAWKEFTRQKFPTLCPPELSSHKDAARTLTTLSRAFDKRAFAAGNLEPHGDITTFPGRKTADKWKRPRGQTIGFTPQLDVFEDVGSTWNDRRETFAFSAGAEICIRHTTRSRGRDDDRWTTYRPLSAREGRDDITTLHLIRPDQQIGEERQHVVVGTANGDLQLLGIPIDDPYDQDVRSTYFTTQGLAVRSSSLLQEPFLPTLLATNLGDSRVALYQVDSEQSKIAASSQFDLKPVLRADGNPSPNHRAWSTNFLSRRLLAVGAGPSDRPIHIYPITEDGLSREGVRKLSLHNDVDALDDSTPLAGSHRKPNSNVYTTVPLPAGNGSSGNGEVFLSGAYDGVIRLHDLRSNRDVEQTYVDPADDSAIYTILPRGREKMLAGTSRHNLLKVFDLRLGAKCYNYLDATEHSKGATEVDHPDSHYNLFLQATSSSSPTRRNGGWNPRNTRITQSSVYSLTSSSAHSPYIYAGIESAIMSLAFTEMLDPHPDPTFFAPWSSERRRQQHGVDPSRDWNKKEVLNLAMYDQRDAKMQLRQQRSAQEAMRVMAEGGEYRRPLGRLDERWRGAEET